MNISSLSESYQDMAYKVYQESMPESDLLIHSNLLTSQDNEISTLHLRIFKDFWYKPFIEGDDVASQSALFTSRFNELFSHIALTYGLSCKSYLYWIGRNIYLHTHKQLYTNFFPWHLQISIRSHDQWIANIHLSIFWNYYLVDIFRHANQEDNGISAVTALLYQTYNYRNIFDDYTESDLQQVLPIYGAHHGSPLTSEYRDRYNFFRKAPHFINHLSNESAMHTHWVYLYQSELGFLWEWEEHMDELDDIVLSQEVMHHIWLLTQDINSKREPQSKINITAEWKVTPFPFRLRDLLFGEFLTITECRHIQAEIMSRLNGILKKNS